MQEEIVTGVDKIPRFLEQHEDIIKNPKMIGALLLPLEMDLLKVMIRYLKPASTRKIQGLLVKRKFSEFLLNDIFPHTFEYFLKHGYDKTQSYAEKMENNTTIEISDYLFPSMKVLNGISRKTEKRLFHKNRSNLSVWSDLIRYIQNTLKRYDPKLHNEEDFTKIWFEQLTSQHTIYAFHKDHDNTYSDTDLIVIFQNVLRQLKVSLPGYNTIMENLAALESWGFLAKRHYPGKRKADFFWVINPRFMNKFDDKFKEILDL